MALTRFRVAPINAHYTGAYDASVLEWRRLGAHDKSRNLLQLVGSHRSRVRSVLDVGCGTGAVLARLSEARLGTVHVGVDMADPDAHRDPRATGLDLRQYDGMQLPFADRSFDLVFASHVLEHVTDERPFLKELRRVARDLVYVEVPCESNLYTSPVAMQRSLDIGHINSYTPDSFALTLATAGLQVEALRVFDHSYAVHAFQTPRLKAWCKMVVRQSLLALSERAAGKIFTYHAGALCTVGDMP